MSKSKDSYIIEFRDNAIKMMEYLKDKLEVSSISNVIVDILAFYYWIYIKSDDHEVTVRYRAPDGKDITVDIKVFLKTVSELTPTQSNSTFYNIETKDNTMN